jgi:D-tyrosyl-tRNA(Tyr) deacylase
MRAVVQRVHSAEVIIDGEAVGAIGTGLLVYLGVAADDTIEDAAYLADKVRYLRVFPDEDKPLNRDIEAVGGGVLAVSAFTTQADARKGRRPSLSLAAAPDQALTLYNEFCNLLSATGVRTERGRFREHMDVHSVNDGPICILLDSRRVF